MDFGLLSSLGLLVLLADKPTPHKDWLSATTQMYVAPAFCLASDSQFNLEPFAIQSLCLQNFALVRM